MLNLLLSTFSEVWQQSKTFRCLFIIACAVLFLAIVAFIVGKTRKKEVPKQQDLSAITKTEDLQAHKEIAEEHIKENVEEPIKEQPIKEKPLVEKPKAEKKYVGKWIIESRGEKEFSSALLANNGEVMLTSEIYTTEEGARNGIKTIIKAVETGEFVIYEDKSKEYYYKLKSANNRFLCAGEIYKTKDGCLKSVESVKRIAKDAMISDGVVQGEKYVDYVPVKNPQYQIKKGFEGKWKIEADKDGKFSAKLYASNGQLMLATEKVKTKATAVSSIETIKKNALDGNFVIDKDKFGRFYYKLRNAQKMVICMGEAYESVADCISALESVRKYAFTAILIG